MGEKIIHRFPLEELNIIFGGIKEKTIYNFDLQLNEITYDDYYKEILNKFSLVSSDGHEYLRSILRKLASSFGITRRHENLLIVDYIKVAKDVHRYFRNIEVDIDEMFKKTENIHDFMKFLNDNPFINETNKKSEEVLNKNGSVINFYDNYAPGYDVLIVASKEVKCKHHYINVTSNNLVFDFVQINKGNRSYIYQYPFADIDIEEFYNEFLRRKAVVCKTINFEVQMADDNPEFSKNHIYHYYNFNRKYNLRYGCFMENSFGI